LGYRRPILCVPTTYNGCTERELFAAGADVAIHANHLLRASLKAMQTVARLVLEHQRSREADPHCATVAEVFDAVGFLDVEAKDARFGLSQPRAIVLAAGEPAPRFRDDFGALPPAALALAGKTILQWQLEAFQRAGIAQAVVVTGYHAAAIPPVAATFLTNPEFATSKSLRTLMLAAAHMDHGFFCTVSDIVFTDRLVREMRSAGKDILLAIDDSPSFAAKRRTKPTIDLVQVGGAHPTARVLDNSSWTIRRIGTAVPAPDATHEFAGIAFFSPRGAAIVRAVHADTACRHPDHLAAADVTDLLQAIIDRGHEVHGFAINSGWIEIQNAEDAEAAGRILHAS
jgi:phosphoenolpyruvate phosphomutase